MKALAAGSALALLLAATGLHAQTAPATDDLITAGIITHEFRALGFPATTDADESGDPRVSSTVDSHKWQIYFYDCDKTGPLDQRRCRSFQFFTDNSMPRPVPMSVIIRWNHDTSYAKAYLQQGDDAGCQAQQSCAARIEVDVLTAETGADPGQTFRKYFEIFRWRAVEFRRAIGAN